MPETKSTLTDARHPRKHAVAIVGRPNVGKSAIFNRIAGKRISIVHSESGVTRDRVVRDIEWEERRFTLIDTGGIGVYENETGRNPVEDAIREQALEAIEDAAVAIMVTDVEAGATPLDDGVARLLRGRGVRVAIAANKADTPARDPAALEFERFGFPVFPVSALHNRGFGDLMQCVLEALPAPPQAATVAPLRVAVVGRPNVGKSSYINRLLRCERVIVSDVPGTTRDPIDIPFKVGRGVDARHYVLIDTAGLRRAGKIDTAVERFSRMRAEEVIAETDVVALVLDAQQGATAQDKRIAASIAEAGKGCVVLVNKWDTRETTQTKYAPELLRAMPFMAHCPLVFCSALSGYNIRRSIDAIDHVAEQVSTTLPTGMLNRVIGELCDRASMPVLGGKPLKIFYATQVGTRPIRLRFFVNRASGIPSNVQSYLIRGLRKRFGLEGAPVLLQFRARREAEPRSRTKPEGDAAPSSESTERLPPKRRIAASRGGKRSSRETGGGESNAGGRRQGVGRRATRRKSGL